MSNCLALKEWIITGVAIDGVLGGTADQRAYRLLQEDDSDVEEREPINTYAVFGMLDDEYRRIAFHWKPGDKLYVI